MRPPLPQAGWAKDRPYGTELGGGAAKRAAVDLAEKGAGRPGQITGWIRGLNHRDLHAERAKELKDGKFTLQVGVIRQFQERGEVTAPNAEDLVAGEGRHLDRVIHGRAQQRCGQIARRAGGQCPDDEQLPERTSRSRQACADDGAGPTQMTVIARLYRSNTRLGG